MVTLKVFGPLFALVCTALLVLARRHWFSIRTSNIIISSGHSLRGRRHLQVGSPHRASFRLPESLLQTITTLSTVLPLLATLGLVLQSPARTFMEPPAVRAVSNLRPVEAALFRQAAEASVLRPLVDPPRAYRALLGVACSALGCRLRSPTVSFSFYQASMATPKR